MAGLAAHTRAKDYTVARAQIETVRRLLSAVENTTMGTGRYLKITPLQSPFPLDPDSQGRERLIVNFDVMRQEQS